MAAMDSGRRAPASTTTPSTPAKPLLPPHTCHSSALPTLDTVRDTWLAANTTAAAEQPPANASPEARFITMPARKRAASEMETGEHVEAPSTLQKLRNMWQFANLAQYIAIFGDAVKIDKDFDIEVRPPRARRLHACAELFFDGLRID